MEQVFAVLKRSYSGGSPVGGGRGTQVHLAEVEDNFPSQSEGFLFKNLPCRYRACMRARVNLGSLTRAVQVPSPRETSESDVQIGESRALLK